MPLQMKLTAITLDCRDPLALAAFYQQATGFVPHPKSDADFAGVTREDGLFIGFQRVDDYQAPRWPEQTAPQQANAAEVGRAPVRSKRPLVTDRPGSVARTFAAAMFSATATRCSGVTASPRA